VVLSIHAQLDEDETDVITWSPAPWTDEGERGAYQQTPDLSAIIREAISMAGSEPASSLTLVLSGEGSGQRSALSFEADPAAAPALRLEFTEDR
jgi:hypothetical protein